MGEDAAAIDVAHDKDAGQTVARCVEREFHVDDVGRAQVGFGGTAGNLGDDDVELCAQDGERAFDAGPDTVAALELVLGVEGASGAAVDHELGGAVALGLDQDGVHFDAGGETGGSGLLGLGATDLQTVRGDIGVVGHVLGFEGHDAVAVLEQDAAEGSGEDGLADGGGGALEHEQGGGCGLRHEWVPPGSRVACPFRGAERR